MNVVTATVLLLCLDCVVRRAQGGSCWQRMSASGQCSGMLAGNTTKEKCCGMQQASGQQTYWVEQSLDRGRLFYYTYFAGGVPGCKPCHGSCETLRCGANERCRMRGSGHPRCVCAPNCTAGALNGSHKGPVCATDGRTYRSHCMLLRAKCKQPYSTVTVSYLGECQVQSCANVKCTREGERCIVDQYNMPHCVMCPGQCPTKGVTPACGSDGRTYETGICGIAQENCRAGTTVVKQYDGRCHDDVVCSEANCDHSSNARCLYDSSANTSVCMRCPPDCDPAAGAAGFQMPVCGNDGNTYRSWCQMRVQACLSGHNVQTLHVGDCGADEGSIRTLISDYYKHHEESFAFEYDREEETRHRKRGAKRKSSSS